MNSNILSPGFKEFTDSRINDNFYIVSENRVFNLKISFSAVQKAVNLLFCAGEAYSKLRILRIKTIF
jgi:hypothetical protein